MSQAFTARRPGSPASSFGLAALDFGLRVRVEAHPAQRSIFSGAERLTVQQLTSELAFGKTVTVRPFGKDRYGRVLGDVVLPDGRVLNEELVTAGMAWHYTRYSKDETLARLERRAREARVGVWSKARPVAPWEFRATR